jgi:hypothetical protein
MYLQIIDSNITFPYELRNLGRDFQNISFPKTLTDELLSDYGIFKVIPTPKPAYDYTKNVSIGTPQNIDGDWTQIWNVTDATIEEIDERLSDKWEEVRLERNRLLSESDWTQLPDSPLLDVDGWKVYRQDLRDVTLQQNPFQIIWPDKP